jgi:hypothetical protein
MKISEIQEALDSLGYAITNHGADIGELLDNYREKISLQVEADELKIRQLGGYIAGHLNYSESDLAPRIYRKIVTRDILHVIKTHLKTDHIRVRANSNLNLSGSHNQHWHYDGDYENNFIIINIPIVTISTKNGPTEVLERSHLGSRNLRLLLKNHKNYHAKKIELECTQFSIRDSRLWHRGTSNTTETNRPMLAFIFERTTHRDELFLHQAPGSFFYNNMYSNGILGKIREHIFVHVPFVGYLQRFLVKNY